MNCKESEQNWKKPRKMWNLYMVIPMQQCPHGRWFLGIRTRENRQAWKCHPFSWLKVTKIIFNRINFWPLSKCLSDIWICNAEQCIKKIAWHHIAWLCKQYIWRHLFHGYPNIYICCFLLQIFFFLSLKGLLKNHFTMLCWEVGSGC